MHKDRDTKKKESYMHACQFVVFLPVMYALPQLFPLAPSVPYLPYRWRTPLTRFLFKVCISLIHTQAWAKDRNTDRDEQGYDDSEDRREEEMGGIAIRGPAGRIGDSGQMAKRPLSSLLKKSLKQREWLLREGHPCRGVRLFRTKKKGKCIKKKKTHNPYCTFYHCPLYPLFFDFPQGH